jgi:hypothetical protein
MENFMLSLPSETLFLSLISSNLPISSNFADGSSTILFSNYSQNSSGTTSSVEVETLVNGGISTAIAQGQTIFIDPGFSELVTTSRNEGEGGAFEVLAESEATLEGHFALKAGQNFSFDFVLETDLTSREVKNSDIEYNEAESLTMFLIFDTSGDRPKLLDYFGMSGELVSAKQLAAVDTDFTKFVSIRDRTKAKDVGGKNGTDALAFSTIGSYSRTFETATQITLVQLTKSFTQLKGDFFIGYLGEDVQYGSIRNDNLKGSQCADKLYGSLGNDLLLGLDGDDILEGGKGRDRLQGKNGNDSLHGGSSNDKLMGGKGDDILSGGIGDDYLIGGMGKEQFIFHLDQHEPQAKRIEQSEHQASVINAIDSSLDNTKKEFNLIQERDTIKDFKLGIDTIILQGIGTINSFEWLQQKIRQGQLTDIKGGTLLGLNEHWDLFLQGVHANELQGYDVMLT